MINKLLSNVTFHFLPKAMMGGIAFFLFLTVCSSVYGQTFFNFQSNLRTAENKPLAYDIFLNVKGDGTAAARVAFKDPVTGKSRMVKVNLVDNTFPDRSDTDKVVNLLPFGDAYNENNAPEKGFLTPRFQFNKTNTYSGLADATAKVYYSFNNKQWYEPIANTYQIIPYGTQLAQFVKRFFYKNEEFYQSFFSVAVPLLTAKEKGRKLFLIAIAATDDPKIGETTRTDLISVQGFFPDQIWRWGVDFHYKEITGKDFTKKAVNAAIDNLKPGPKDIIVLYYSGHGFRYTDDTSKYPRLALVSSGSQSPDNDNLSLEDIYKRILTKKALVSIVLADCCNQDYGSSPPVGKVQQKNAASPGSPTPLNLVNWRALFLPDKPLSILACAAEKDQLAAGNELLGGFFTHFMQNEMQKSLVGTFNYGESSWTSILNNAKEYTRRQALTAECKDGPCDGDRSLQQPEFKVTSGKPPLQKLQH
jgi:hypothetical protein